MASQILAPRKQRTRQHVIADLSVNHVERLILEAGHTAVRLSSDYSYDLIMTTFGEGGYTGEELKLVNEVRKILELPDLAVSPTTVRVPVFTAHSVAVNAETELKVTRVRAREAFAAFPGLRLWDEPAEGRYPMPVTVEGQDDCFDGRIREDISLPNALNFWVVGDQLRKGAALNGVQIAELLIR